MLRTPAAGRVRTCCESLEARRLLADVSGTVSVKFGAASGNIADVDVSDHAVSGGNEGLTLKDGTFKIASGVTASLATMEFSVGAGGNSDVTYSVPMTVTLSKTSLPIVGASSFKSTLTIHTVGTEAAEDGSGGTDIDSSVSVTVAYSSFPGFTFRQTDGSTLDLDFLGIGGLSKGKFTKASKLSAGATAFENTNGPGSESHDFDAIYQFGAKLGGPTSVGEQREAVERTVRGVLHDASDHGVHGVKITAGSHSAFSDYDGTSKTLDDAIDGDFEVTAQIGWNVTEDGVFKRFELADAATSTLQVSVATLGRTASITQGAGVQSQLTDAARAAISLTAENGGLAAGAKVELKPIVLSALTTVSPDGDLLILKDQQNADNDDVVKRRAATSGAEKQIADSDRYKAEVGAVVKKLADLGFRGPSAATLDPTVTAWGSGADDASHERAIKLFQSLSFVSAYVNQVFDASVGGDRTGKKYSGAAAGKEFVSGRGDAKTIAALNDVDHPIWTNQLPSNWTLKSGNQGWITSTAYAGLAAIEGSHTLVEASQSQAGKFGPHSTHSVGTSIDTRSRTAAGEFQGVFYRPLGGHTEKTIKGYQSQRPTSAQEYTSEQRAKDAKALQKANTSWSSAKARREAETAAYAAGKRWIVNVEAGYDRAATQAFLLELGAAPRRREVYFNDPALLADPELASIGLRPVDGHGDHIHVSFSFDPNDAIG